MTDLLLTTLFGFYRTPLGRRLHAMRRCSELVKSDPNLLTIADTCVQHDTVLLDERIQWAEQRARKGTFPPRVLELDVEHDRLWGAIYKMADAQECGPPDAASTVAATKLKTAVFVEGLPPLVNTDYVQERETTKAWLQRFKGVLAPEIAAIGATHLVALLAAVTEEFGRLLDQQKPKAELTYEHLSAENAVGHELMLRFVVAVCAKYPADAAACTAILEPILEQNTILGDLYRKRAVTDVNPDTGEVTTTAGGPVVGASTTPATTEAPIGSGGSPFIGK